MAAKGLGGYEIRRQWKTGRNMAMRHAVRGVAYL